VIDDKLSVEYEQIARPVNEGNLWIPGVDERLMSATLLPRTQPAAISGISKNPPCAGEPKVTGNDTRMSPYLGQRTYDTDVSPATGRTTSESNADTGISVI